MTPNPEGRGKGPWRLAGWHFPDRASLLFSLGRHSFSQSSAITYPSIGVGDLVSVGKSFGFTLISGSEGKAELTITILESLAL